MSTTTFHDDNLRYYVVRSKPIESITVEWWLSWDPYMGWHWTEFIKTEPRGWSMSKFDTAPRSGHGAPA